MSSTAKHIPPPPPLTEAEKEAALKELYMSVHSPARTMSEELELVKDYLHESISDVAWYSAPNVLIGCNCRNIKSKSKLHEVWVARVQFRWNTEKKGEVDTHTNLYVRANTLSACLRELYRQIDDTANLITQKAHEYE